MPDEFPAVFTAGQQYPFVLQVLQGGQCQQGFAGPAFRWPAWTQAVAAQFGGGGGTHREPGRSGESGSESEEESEEEDPPEVITEDIIESRKVKPSKGKGKRK